MQISSSRLTLAAIVVCALLVAGAVVVLTLNRQAPGPPKQGSVASPSPSTPSPSVTSPPASPTVTASGSPPLATTPGPATPAASPSPRTTPPVALVDGPYGFPVPRGWAFAPLSSTSGTSQAAHWTDPGSGARIDYLVVETAAIYSVDHLVNLASIEAALPCKQLPPTSYTYLPGKGPRYTCAPVGGMNVNGLVLVKPYPQGFRLLQIQMPAAQDAVTAQILAGFH